MTRRIAEAHVALAGRQEQPGERERQDARAPPTDRRPARAARCRPRPPRRWRSRAASPPSRTAGRAGRRPERARPSGPADHPRRSRGVSRPAPRAISTWYVGALESSKARATSPTARRASPYSTAVLGLELGACTSRRGSSPVRPGGGRRGRRRDRGGRRPRMTARDAGLRHDLEHGRRSRSRCHGQRSRRPQETSSTSVVVDLGDDDAGVGRAVERKCEVWRSIEPQLDDLDHPAAAGGRRGRRPATRPIARPDERPRCQAGAPCRLGVLSIPLPG